MQVVQSLSPVIIYLRPNWHTPPFADLRIRQAFSLALDRQALARETLQDAGQPSIHLVPQDVPSYNPGLADAAGRTGKDALRTDMVAARRLANACAAEKRGGSCASCPPVVIDPEPRSGQNIAPATAIQRQWQVAFPDWPSEVFVTCSPWLKPGASQFSDASNGHPSCLKLYRQAEHLLVTQVAAIPLYQSINTTVVRSHVAGWRLAPTGMTPLSVWQATYIRR
jgi:ABC-type transport system substrate-binding protein